MADAERRRERESGGDSFRRFSSPVREQRTIHNALAQPGERPCHQVYFVWRLSWTSNASTMLVAPVHRKRNKLVSTAPLLGLHLVHHDDFQSQSCTGMRWAVPSPAIASRVMDFTGLLLIFHEAMPHMMQDFTRELLHP